MNYTIDLSCNAFRQLLDEDEKKRYDDILNFFIDHRYDENNSIEKLMLIQLNTCSSFVNQSLNSRPYTASSIQSFV